MKLKMTVVYLLAAAAAVATRYALKYAAHDPLDEIASVPDSLNIRFVTGVAFFTVLLGLIRWTSEDPEPPAADSAPNQDSFKPKATPQEQETAAEMARIFAGVTDDASRRRAIRMWLSGVSQCTALIPFVFYLRFGEIGALGWGLTVFFDVYCLLWAFGLFFLFRTEYHTHVALRGDWIDHLGAFWLVGCAFGPFFGWIVTEAFTLTPGSWHLLYGLRIFLAAAIPIVLALPTLRYLRGKAAMVGLPLVIVLTFLPVSTAVQVSRDFWEGPSMRQDAITGESELYLKHTDRTLESGEKPAASHPPRTARQ
jgi:hypothetical protein